MMSALGLRAFAARRRPLPGSVRQGRDRRLRRAAAPVIEALESRQLLSAVTDPTSATAGPVELTTNELKQLWLGASPDFKRDLAAVEAQNPTYTSRLDADLAKLNLPLLAPQALPPTLGSVSTGTTSTQPQTGSTTSSAAALSPALLGDPPAISGQTLGTLQSASGTNWYGFAFTTGASALSVSQLGRWVAANSTGTHTVELVDAAGSNPVLGSASVNCAGTSAGQYAYGSLSSPILLQPNHSYFVLSQEASGGDSFYGQDTAVTSTPDLTVNQAESYSGSAYSAGTVGAYSYGPLNFMYSLVPTVSTAGFLYNTLPHQLTFKFTEDVSSSLVNSWQSALYIQNLSTGTFVYPTSYSYDRASQTATFSFSSSAPLPDGQYVATLSGRQVTDAWGHGLLGSDGVSGHSYSFNFRFLDADFNGDGLANINDLQTLANNYGSAGHYSQGDANYDGVVNFTDQMILSRRYNDSLFYAVPTNITTSNVTDNSVSLAWSLTSGTSPIGYTITRTNTNVQGSLVTVTEHPTTTSFIDTNLAPNTTYTYTVASTRSSIATPPVSVTTAPTPIVLVTGNSSALLNAQYALHLSATWSGANNFNQWDVNWGDGTTTHYTTAVATVTHVYTAQPSSPITVSAEFHTGIYSNQVEQVELISAPNITVTTFANDPNSANVIQFLGNYATTIGIPYTLGITWAYETGVTSYAINWGDGSPLVTGGDAPQVSPQHTFRDIASADLITATEVYNGTTYSSSFPVAIVSALSGSALTNNIVVKFQPNDPTPFVVGTSADLGLVYGDRGNFDQSRVDYVYGWDSDISDQSVDRNTGDRAHDTFLPIQGHTWTIGLPAGQYDIQVVAGDPQGPAANTRYQTQAITSSGSTTLLDVQPTAGSPYASSAWQVVTVGSDGRLSLRSGPQASNNIIDSVEIVPASDFATTPATPSSLTAYAESSTAVNLNWMDSSDNETSFQIFRSDPNHVPFSQVATTQANVTSYTDTVSPGTTYSYYVVAVNANAPSGSTSSGQSNIPSVTVPASSAEGPYKGARWVISSGIAQPIQAEDFDTGGQNVAYYDTSDANAGGRYRATSADIGTIGPLPSGESLGPDQFMLGWNKAGEWYNYQVNVQNVGPYRLEFNVASSGPGGTIHLTLDGQTDLSGPVKIPDTGGWNAYQVISVDNVTFPSTGNHTLTLHIDSVGPSAGAGNFDWIKFVAVPSDQAAPENLRAVALSDQTVKLTWEDDSPTAQYRVYRTGNGASNLDVTPTPLPAGTTEFVDTNLGGNQTYSYVVTTNTPSYDTENVSNTAIVRTPATNAVVLSPSADTYVLASTSATNYGGSPTLNAQQGSSGEGLVLLKFDASALASAGTLSTVVLRVFGSEYWGAQTGVPVAVYGLGSTSWTASSVTWATRPTLTSTLPTGASNESPIVQESTTANESSGRWYEWDVTDYVNAQLTAGQTTIGFGLQPTVPTASYLTFNSSASGINPPALIVSTSSALFPAAPSNLTAQNAPDDSSGNASVALTWQDNAPLGDAVVMQQSTDGVTFTNSTSDLSSNATNQTVLGLLHNTRYYFRVYARKGTEATGQKAYSNVVNLITAALTDSISGSVFNDQSPPLTPTTPGTVHLSLLVTGSEMADKSLAQPSGVDYYPKHDSIIVSTSGATPFVEVMRDGTTRPFASPLGFFGKESAVAVVPADNNAGFIHGNLFTAAFGDGAAAAGGILQLNSAGQVVSTWHAPPIAGAINALTFDRTGVFGNALIALTNAGQIYLVDDRGNFAQLADLGGSSSANFEAAVVLPNDSTKYGPYAGNILVAPDDQSGNIFAVKQDGTFLAVYGIPMIEDLMVIPNNANFFGVTKDGSLLGAPAGDLAYYSGQILAVSEGGSQLSALSWDGSAWQQTPMSVLPPTLPDGNLDAFSGWERVGFGPAGVNSLPSSQQGYQGWTVHLKNGNNPEVTTQTDSNGLYSFGSLVAGAQYTVWVTPPAGYLPADPTPAGGTYTITIPSNGTPVTDVDFAYHATAAATPPQIYISSSPNGTWQPNQTFTYTFTVTDTNPTTGQPNKNARLMFDLPLAPQGITLSTNGPQSVSTGNVWTGTIQWTPQANQHSISDNVYVVLRVTDPNNYVALQPFTLNYVAPPAPGAPVSPTVTYPTTSQVQLTWQVPPNPSQHNYQYTIYRNGNPLATTTALTYVDASVMTATSYIYELWTQDETTGLESTGITVAAFTPAQSKSAGNVTLTQPPLQLGEGQSYSGSVATVSGADLNQSYSATINWGDGTQDQATFNVQQSTWSINGSHAYAEAGTYPMQVTFNNGSLTLTTAAAALISDAPLTVTPSVVGGLTQYAQFTATVATFTDSQHRSNSVTSDYLAWIDWGDKHYTQGNVVAVDASQGSYRIDGTFSYADANAHTITVYVQDGNAPIAVSLAPVTPAPSGAIPAPTLNATVLSSTQIELQWNDNPAMAGYVLYRTDTTAQGPLTPIPDAPTYSSGELLGHSPYFDQGLTPGDSYTYYIVAVDNFGSRSSASASISKQTYTLPLPPTNVTATAVSGKQVLIQWTPATQPTNTAAVQGWDILRTTTSPSDPTFTQSLKSVLAPGQVIFPTDPTTFKFYDETCAPNTTYFYVVKTVDIYQDKGSQSGSVQVTTGNTDYAPIAPPSNLSAGDAGGYYGNSVYRIGLTWNEPASNDLIGYDVYRSTDPNFATSTLIGSPADPEYVDDLKPQGSIQQYYYRVQAIIAGGPDGELASPPSAAVLVDLSVPPQAPDIARASAANPPTAELELGSDNNPTGSVLVQWSDAWNNEAEFDIYRGTVSNGTTLWDLTAPVGRVTANGTSFVDASAEPGTSYAYKVAPINTAVTSQNIQFTAPTNSVTTPLGLIGAPKLTWDPSISTWNTIYLTWPLDPVQPLDASADRFYVYRRTADTAYVEIGQTTRSERFFLDNNDGAGLDPSVTYNYTVRAVDSAGHISAPSAELALKTPTPAQPTRPAIRLTSPAPTSLWDLSSQTAISGVVEDGSANASLTWTLMLHPAALPDSNHTNDVVLATGSGSVGSATGGGAFLADLDPTRFPNGNYQLILSATDANASLTGTLSQAVSLHSNLKLGNLTLPLTDASFNVPGGSPIAISRSYDSATVSASPTDFGYGWRFDSMDTNLHTTITRASLTDETSLAMADGDLVYITLPGGDQHVFEFLAQPNVTNPPPVTQYAGDDLSYSPKFLCVDGSGATLTIGQSITSGFAQGFPVALQRVSEGSRAIYFEYFTQQWYNPGSAIFGGAYTLTTRDTTKYVVNASSGRLEQVTDPQNNITAYPWNVASGTGQVTFNSVPVININFDSSVSGRIDSISDARPGMSRQLQYNYDQYGNLLGFIDSAGNKTAYATNGELAVPNLATGTNVIYAVLKRQLSGGTWQYWNQTPGVGWEAKNTANWPSYAVSLTASPQSGTANWFTGSLPAAITAGTLVTVAFYQTSGSPASTDGIVTSQNLSVPTPQTLGLNGRLTGVVNSQGISVLQATYDLASGQLTSLYDAYSNKSSIGTGGFDGSSGNQDVTDLTSASGGSTSGDTQTIYDRQGDVTRTIQKVTSGGTTSYLVTVHDYGYAAGDSISDATYYVTNQNALAYQQDWQPFQVAYPDNQGLRFTQAPTVLQQRTDYKLMDETAPDPSDPGVFRPSQITTYTPDGRSEATVYGYQKTHDSNNQPTVTETIVDPYGNQTVNVYDPTLIQLQSTTNATGETTHYGYTAGSLYTYHDPAHTQIDYTGVAKGLPAETYKLMPDGSAVVLSSNVYYTHSASSSAVISQLGSTTYGGDPGELYSTTDASGVITYYTYNADGTSAATYHLWTDPTNSANQQWVFSANHYNGTGNVDWIDSAVYVDSGTTINAPSNLVGYLKRAVTHYNSIGKQDYSETLYFDNTWTQKDTGDYTAYHYDAKGNLVETVYPEGSWVRSIYDSMGRVIWQTNRDSTSGFFYPTATNTIYDAAGRAVQTLRYSSVKLLVTPDPSNSSIYDATVDLSVATQLSSTTTVYDALGRVDHAINADGHTTQYTYLADGGTTTTTAADVASAKSSTTSEADRYEIAILKPGGTFTANDVFSVSIGTRSTSASGATLAALCQSLATNITRDISGVTATYDADNQTVHVQWTTPDTTWMPPVLTSTGTSTFTYQLIHSAWQQDGLGNTTVTEYDALGRTYRVDYQDTGHIETLYSVGTTPVAGQQALQAITNGGYQETQFDQLGQAVESFYDATGKLTAEYQPQVADAAQGNMLVRPEWQYSYDHYGNEVAQTDPYGHVTAFTFDAFGRETSRSLPLQGRENWQYDPYGRVLVHTDFNGNAATYTYYQWGTSQNGRVNAIQYTLYGAPAAQETITYTWNRLGNIASTFDNINGGAYYYYDENYTYGVSGGTVTIDSSGTINRAVTDREGRLTSIQYDNGRLHYAYDAATGRLVETWTDQIANSPITDTYYGYDAQGRLASVTAARQNGAAPMQGSSVTNRYDAVGNSIPTGSSLLPTTLYQYDASGNLIKQLNPNNTETDYDYTGYWSGPGGNNAAGVFGTEVVTNYRGGSSGTKLSQFTYSFDADRRKISALEYMLDPGELSSNTSLTTWTYDALSRLVQEAYDYGNDNAQSGGKTTDDYTDVYTYDLVGNRITKTRDLSSDGTIDQTINYTYNAANQLLTETSVSGNSLLPQYTTVYGHYNAGALVAGYDNNGSLLEKHTTGATTDDETFTYNARNQMATATINGTTTNYLFDDDGLLNSTWVGSSQSSAAWKWYLVDRNSPSGYARAVEAWDSIVSGTSPAVTYTIGRTILGQTTSTNIATVVMPDGEGSTRQLTAFTNSTNNGQVVTRKDFDAFGGVISFTASTHAGNVASTLVGYRGALLDPTTGNIIMGVREYNAPTGRFTTEDSYVPGAGDLQNANLYVYVGGNPINLRDPSGHFGATDVTVSMGLMLTLAGIGLGSVFLLHQSHESNFTPNWGDAIGAVEHGMASEQIAFSNGSASDIAAEMYADLQRFNYFDVNNDNVADVAVSGNRAAFTTKGFFGYASDRLNPHNINVQLVNGPGQYELSAVTLGGHMLAGIRRWRVVIVQQNPPVLRVETEAYEQTAGQNIFSELGNEAGRAMMGQDAQYRIWKVYFENIASHWAATDGATSSGVTVAPVQDVGSVNPWRSQLPAGLQ